VNVVMNLCVHERWGDLASQEELCSMELPGHLV
jgi:hypothetical protein